MFSERGLRGTSSGEGRAGHGAWAGAAPEAPRARRGAGPLRCLSHTVISRDGVGQVPQSPSGRAEDDTAACVWCACPSTAQDEAGWLHPPSESLQDTSRGRTGTDPRGGGTKVRHVGRRQEATTDRRPPRAVSPEHTLNLARPRPGHSPTSCHSKSGDRCGTGKQGSTRAADFAEKKKDEMRRRGLSYLPTPPRHGSSLRVFLSTKVLPSFPPRSSQELMSPEREGGAVPGPDGDPGQG